MQYRAGIATIFKGVFRALMRTALTLSRLLQCAPASAEGCGQALGGPPVSCTTSAPASIAAPYGAGEGDQRHYRQQIAARSRHARSARRAWAGNRTPLQLLIFYAALDEQSSAHARDNRKRFGKWPENRIWSNPKKIASLSSKKNGC